ncbi:2-hydroxyacid dehydrogenase [Azospirillum brasilense]|uniref:2-hydroxyacid dehydrogenase n=1 Tax=Azospirillum brasilense TaxID=192 RepID=A0A0P0F1P5_AZOBR|nr:MULTISPECIES: 2-hydroxyacid dehydrogenase [Azospirillum]ALJ37125.1 dihydrofolate reductase [Azospirillum brasilense]MDW7551822.1 2-hydroxyacid dehydrogenase [Azospirillum brasilense]MDW7591257.1 2-hydroxyacid dehydrogenase [Azospirillum brasilense]MDW7626427.1 2-hydroxyacid dehydrogenase [Azospirillum brasilense]MDX5951224.1 2-hydroxyacid dehydrogenase [Azospirillum brasilense]
MKPEILLVESMMPDIEAALDAGYTVHRFAGAPDRDRLVAEVGPRVRAVVTGGGTGVSNAVMDACTNLGIVAINGVGTDAVDLKHAAGRGVRVTNTPDVLTDDVADLAIGLMIAGSRRMMVGDRFVRAGRWPNGGLPLARKVTGKRLGILGLGRIGMAIAQRAAGFGMDIAYTNRKPRSDVPYRFVASPVDLARESDILIVAASAGPDARNMVNRAVIEALGPDGLLVNVARGAVVDEPELVAALTDGRLGGAALDVFANEPHAPEALFGLDNVVLQPHQASATVETRMAMGNLVLTNLSAFFAGQPLPTAVV